MNEQTSPLSEVDRSILHALLMAIGHTPDARVTARDFLAAFVPLCALDGAALWWRDAAHDATLRGGDLLLLAAEPAALDVAGRIPNAHPFAQHLERNAACRITNAGNDDAPEGCILLPLSDTGLLVVYPSAQHAPSPALLTHLPTIAGRLAAALDTAFAYERLQASERQLRESNRRLDESKRIADQYATANAQARAQLHTLFRHLPDLVWLKNPDGVYLACNGRFERFFGTTEEAIVGRTDYDFIDREQADFFRAHDRLTLERDATLSNEEWISFADDGHRECLETTKAPMYDEHGTLIGVLGIGHDITERKAMEEALRKAEAESRRLAALLRLLCDNVPDMIWAKGLDKRYLFANKAICEHLLFAQDIEEPIGKTDLFFARRERASHPEDPNWHTFGECCQDSDALTLQFGKPSVFEEYGNLRGKPVYFEVHKSPFYNEHGEVIGTVGSARDITERKRIDAELEQHRRHLAELVQLRTAALLQTEARASQILNSTADGVYGIDAAGKITFINPAACRMLGLAAEAAIGRCSHALFHHHRADGSPYPIEDCGAHRSLGLGRETRVDDEVFWHSDGHPVPVMYAVHPTTADGQPNGAVISFVDISAQRAAALARERAIAAAEQLARVKSEFLANMSHEIRTPLNGIIGFAQIGLRTFTDTEQAYRAFEKILSSSKRLLVVVNDVLDFSKLEAGKLRIVARETVLREVVEHALELVGERAAAKHLSLALDFAADLPQRCLSDPQRISQILLNLLSNAVKFTERGEVRLSVARQGDQLAFSVADTGIGIASAELGRLFDPFHQVDASLTRRYDGSGLGLAICRRLLELMGGTIEVQSHPEHGSVFTFRIPYVPWQPTAATPETPADDARAERHARPLRGLRILIAEDDATSQMVLEHNLREEGAEVITVANGEDAVTRIRDDGSAAYDLILMDVQMPRMDGYEATRRILTMAPGLPIIGQTAHAFSEEIDKCFAAGMLGHIAKPIDPTKLTASILHHLKRDGQWPGSRQR